MTLTTRSLGTCAAFLLVLALILPARAMARTDARQNAEAEVKADVESVLADTVGSDGRGSPGDEAGVRTLEAVRVRGEAPTVDGKLDDPVWSSAPVATDFVQVQPDDGAPASERTEARILYGPDALYVAIRAFDSRPDSIEGQLTRRDQNSYSDFVYVGVDSYFDRRTAFVFAVNPVGVKKDIYISDDTHEDDSWYAVWDVATSRDDQGWSAEFRIPYSQLRFDDSPVQTWGIEFVRDIARYDETDAWAPISQKQDRKVSLFGHLQGLRDLHSPDRLEVEPYTMARVDRGPGEAENPFYRRTALSGTAGADVKYGVTNDLTLNLTLNPDFGQVEADPGQVNLSAFETFFPEKRPFFVEGKNIFDFGIGFGDGDGGNESLFYSRRIGRAPHGSPDPGDGGFVDTPDNTTILGAWKLSGKTSSGLSIGALHAVTGQEDAHLVDGNGVRSTKPVEPLTNYSVARLQKDFRDGQSAVGMIATATNRDGTVADELDLRRAAYSGGVDFRHRFGIGGNYEVSGYVLGSRVSGSPAAIVNTQESSTHYYQRPDAEYLEVDSARTSLPGWSAFVQGGKRGGGYWRAMGFLRARSPGFEVNDLGFERNADDVTGAAFIGYHKTDPGEHLRDWNVNVNLLRSQTFGGLRTQLSGNVNGSFTLPNLWGGFVGLARNLEAYSPTLLRGGPSFRTEANWNGWGGFHSDNRKTVQAGVGTNWSVAPDSRSWRYRVGPNVRWRPSGRMSLRLGPFLERSVQDHQWIDNADAPDGTHYLVGRLGQTTVGLTTRLEMAFTPDLSFQLYAQPFVSSGTYTDFREVSDPRADRYADRFRNLDATKTNDGYDVTLGGEQFSFDDPAFNLMQFRSNAVLRWEYRPGSTLYLVWSQSRDRSGTAGDFALGNEMSDLFGAVPQNVLMLKVSYWLNP